MTKSTGTPMQSFTMNVITENGYIKCFKCGKILAKNWLSINNHKKFCGKVKLKRNKDSIKCLRIFNKRSQIHVFYDKGKIHALNNKDASIYFGIDHSTLKRRLDKNWTYEQLIYPELGPDNYDANKRNTDTRKLNKRNITDKEKERQNLMKSVFKPRGK